MTDTMDIEELKKRLRDISENGLRQDGEECEFLATVACVIEQQAERIKELERAMLLPSR